MIDECTFDVYEHLYIKTLNTDYLKEHGLMFNENQMLITGRACKDLKIGDTLLSERNNLIAILNIFAYGHEMDIISKCMSCALVIDIINENLSGQKLRSK